MAELLAPAVPWAAWAVVLPLVLAALALPAGRPAVPWLPLAGAVGGVLVAIGLAVQVASHGVLHHTLGGWRAPLGIELRADGLSAAMVLTVALVTAPVAVYALIEFAHPKGREARHTLFFWPLLLFLWASLNAVFLSADLFNLYVGLELLTLAAVALVTLEGEPPALVAGMRYLLVALLGSLAYLLGVALVYGGYGTLDIGLLAERIEPGPAETLALALMTVGLLAKTALFPLHFWLPPAHANAPAPASALLSGLVVKASFYMIVRLWFDVFADAVTPAATQVLGLLGAIAILWGSVLALRQIRFKLLIAYSTAAQIGYLFLMFPLAGGGEAQPWAAGGWTGGIYHAIAHAFAKASMFLAAGTIIQALGHDRIDGMAGAARHLPVTVFALGLAGLTLMGLPPSGGFIAKWLLLTAAIASGQWVWAVVMMAGGLLAAAYMFRALAQAFAPPRKDQEFTPVPVRLQLAPLLLAVASVALGVLSMPPFALLQIGRPEAAEEGLE